MLMNKRYTCISLGLCSLMLCSLYIFLLQEESRVQLDSSLSHQRHGRGLASLGEVPSVSNIDNPPDDVVDNDSVKKILLVTYMRGGSSFAGEFFNYNPDVFYWFEPLAPIFNDIVGEMDSRNWLVHDNLTLRMFNESQETTIFSTFENIFNCAIDKLPTGLLTHSFTLNPIWNKSDKMKSYRTCFFEHYNNFSDKEASAQFCLQEAISSCTSSTTRVIKTVRMRMDHIIDFVSRHVPEVSIVHVVRDPRGILNSRWESSRDHRISNFTLDTEILCHQMEHDLRMKDALDEKYPGIVSTVLYEDLALNPMKSASKLYEELRLSLLPNEVKTWYHKSTNGTGHNFGPLGTDRQNVASNLENWRTSLADDLKEYINTQCENVITEYGYAM